MKNKPNLFWFTGQYYIAAAVTTFLLVAVLRSIIELDKVLSTILFIGLYFGLILNFKKNFFSQSDGVVIGLSLFYSFFHFIFSTLLPSSILFLIFMGSSGSLTNLTYETAMKAGMLAMFIGIPLCMLGYAILSYLMFKKSVKK